MKVPFQTNQKLQNPTLINTIISNTSSSYEPKSVLDLRRSPTAGGGIKTFPESDTSPLLTDAFDDGSWEDDHNFDELDSLMRELDSKFLPEFPPSQYYSFDSAPDFDFSSYSNNMNLNHHQQLQLAGDFTPPQLENGDFVDDLIRAADCIESNDLQLASVILARLNHQSPPVGKPLQRAAFYFKQAMQSLLLTHHESSSSSSTSDIVQAIKAYKTFSNVSPIVMFSNFTANQAILDAVEGSRLVHVVDFDIGYGGQWASFMTELVQSPKMVPILRITAVVPENYGVESRLIRDSLNQLARELRIGFQIDFVSIRTFEYLSFKSIKTIDGEKTAVVLSPSVFQVTGPGFLHDLRLVSPHVVVLVDTQGFTDGRGPPSFRQTVIDGLQFYSTVMESLEAANRDCLGKIETFLLCPKITAAIEAAGSRVLPWRETFAAAGMRPVGLSQFAEFQAEFLLRKVQVRGFHVAKRQAEMVLCWHERALVATSAWRCL